MTLEITWNTETSKQSVSGDLEFATTEHVLQFDVVTTIRSTLASTVTEHAVERGSPIVDHKRSERINLQIDCEVTNTPLDVPPPSGYAGSQVLSATQTANEVGVTVLTFSAEFNRVQDVLETLQRLVAEPTLVTVSTPYQTFENMTFQQVEPLREAGMGSSMKFTMNLTELNIVQSRQGEVPEPREPRASRPRDEGAQETGIIEEITGLQIRDNAILQDLGRLLADDTSATGQYLTSGSGAI